MIDKTVVRHRALELARDGASGIASRLSTEFGISRQAAHGHLQSLVRDGKLVASGQTRARVYRLAAIQEAARSYPRAGLREDVVWNEVFAPIVADLPQSVRDIWHYGVTEMVNNAIDHSGSEQVHVGIQRNALDADGWVADDGEGIFLKIQRAFNLYDPRESILELAKGKLTTDPANHTGEGIFFTSRAFDVFDIRSGRLHFMHDGHPPDVLFERPQDAPGTLVLMRLANDSARILNDIFAEFAAPDEFRFDRTVVPVKLAQYEGEKLVSRSQAKRLYNRFERFRHVVLDFDGVSEIGQAFADELFRVFKNTHPTVVLVPTNMTEAVARMVRRIEADIEASAPNGG